MRMSSGPVAAVAEAPLGPVELGRADAEVEERPAGAVVARGRGAPRRRRWRSVEAGAAHGDAVAEAGQPGGGGGDGVGVLVEAEDRQVRVGLEQGLGVAAAAQRWRRPRRRRARARTARRRGRRAPAGARRRVRARSPCDPASSRVVEPSGSMSGPSTAPAGGRTANEPAPVCWSGCWNREDDGGGSQLQVPRGLAKGAVGPLGDGVHAALPPVAGPHGDAAAGADDHDRARRGRRTPAATCARRCGPARRAGPGRWTATNASAASSDTMPRATPSSHLPEARPRSRRRATGRGSRRAARGRRRRSGGAGTGPAGRGGSCRRPSARRTP